ncbi:hypothetical protein [Aeromonas phage ZPAH34]|uniref:hypothetical protein n=1 Tax=Aeromonas phage ZPAH34 TaxID=2924888 RepID=UPI0023295982|nr:hypothetical protein PQD16_gp080 [Aeromonas phage ZPAH34]UOX39603.1 hypothetical protein [Aeromonas phage ZPAH34]
MNVNIDQMDHVFDTIDGFESICNKDFKTTNAKYTQTVLRLNGCDLTAIAGQEGLGGAIKEGAKKVLEMIWNLIKGIKEFFFGSKSKVKDFQVKEIEKETKVVLETIKKQPDLEEVVKKKTDQLAPSVNKIKKAATPKTIEVRFAPYVTFMSEYFNDVGDAKIEGYVQGGITGKVTINLDGKRDHQTLLNAFRVLSESFSRLDKKEGTEEIEAFAVIQSVENGNKIITAAEKFRTVAKDVLQNVNESLERATVYYEKLLKDGNEHTKAEAVLKYTQALGKAATKMAKLVAECDNFIIQVGSAISKINKEIVGGNSKIDNLTVPTGSLEEFEAWMNS